MNLVNLLDKDLRKRLREIRTEHRLRGCGVFGKGCICTCEDHPCKSMDERDWECARCHDAGFLRTGRRRVNVTERGQELEYEYRACPDCTTGRMMLSPTLPWEQHDRYQFANLTGVSHARRGVERWLRSGRETKPFLVLTGPSGTGKTHAAIAAAFSLTSKGLRCKLMTVPDLLTALQSTFGRTDRSVDSVMGDAKEVDVLVLDDLGAEKPSDWSGQQVYALVNDRYVHRRLTIFTSNITDPPTNDRNWSRILGDLSSVVDTTGPDRRRE
jgi:DNA replication protein DnaC